MFKFLTSKKGYTLVELMIVLVLLSLGGFAVINIVSVAYRSFNKSEERYIKQEAVKEVAARLEGGKTGVLSAKTADIFDVVDVVPTKNSVDEAYSYLFAEESYDDKGVFEGYYIYVQNSGVKRADAEKLSETPIYIEIKPYYETITDLGNNLDLSDDDTIKPKQYNSVTVSLSALETDYKRIDANNDGKIDKPLSDDKYYTLNVAYHFPNMATSKENVMVNHKTEDVLSASATYNQTTGALTGNEVETIHCPKEKGEPYQGDHCILEDTTHFCCVSDCGCPGNSGIVLKVYCDSIVKPNNAETSIFPPSMCFIATASYGLDSGEVGMLCAFRDECLKTNPFGRAFVNAYYAISPPIAEFISESEPLKAVVRTALKPLIVVAEYALNEEIRAEGAVSFVVLMLCGAGASATLIKLNKQRKKETSK